MSFDEVGALRDQVRPGDAAAVGALVEGSGFFNEEETDVAIELVEETLARGEASGYSFLFAEGDEGLSGYACYGRIAGTAESWDLYWIVARQRGSGVGTRLLEAVEDRILAAGGGRIWVETSSREQYVSTRAFYERRGYAEAARLEGFYGPRDAKVVLVKAVAPEEEQ